MKRLMLAMESKQQLAGLEIQAVLWIHCSNLPSQTLPMPSYLQTICQLFFSKQGLAKYTDLFVRHEVDLQTFATLTEQDLREIGVPTFGARKKLLLLANSKVFFNLKLKSLY